MHIIFEILSLEHISTCIFINNIKFIRAILVIYLIIILNSLSERGRSTVGYYPQRPGGEEHHG